MAKEFNIGLMEPSTKVHGSKGKLMEKESSLTSMEILIMANGKMIKLMDMGYMSIRRQVQNIKDIGRMICSTDQVSRFMQMGTSMKECLNKEKGMGKALII